MYAFLTPTKFIDSQVGDYKRKRRWFKTSPIPPNIMPNKFKEEIERTWIHPGSAGPADFQKSRTKNN